MKQTEKAERIYKLFGRLEGYKCKDCSNFCRITYRDKTYRKCLVYGNTNSDASDWTGKTTACGLFNKDYSGNSVMEIAKHWSKSTKNTIEGQVELEL